MSSLAFKNQGSSTCVKEEDQPAAQQQQTSPYASLGSSTHSLQGPSSYIRADEQALEEHASPAAVNGGSMHGPQPWIKEEEQQEDLSHVGLGNSQDWQDAFESLMGANAQADGLDDELDSSPLPVRYRCAPDHAHSAPAVLSQSLEGIQHTDAEDSDMPLQSNKQTDPSSSVIHQTELIEAVRNQSTCCDPSYRGPGLHGAEASAVQSDAAANIEQQHPPQEEQRQGACGCEIVNGQQDNVYVSLLDQVDVAEQTRILTQIQHEALRSRQCLPTKKRQLTLGGFVASKRVK